MQKVLLVVAIFIGLAACDKSTTTRSTTTTVVTQNEPGGHLVETGVLLAQTGGTTGLTLTCQKSSTDSCHYRLWQVVSDTTDAGGRRIEKKETTLALLLHQNKVVSPALAGSSFCHAPDKTPDAANCSQTIMQR